VIGVETDGTMLCFLSWRKGWRRMNSIQQFSLFNGSNLLGSMLRFMTTLSWGGEGTDVGGRREEDEDIVSAFYGRTSMARGPTSEVAQPMLV
jgi:hypothetical protein